VESDIGSLKVADRLGYIFTDRPIVSTVACDRGKDSLGDGISINLLSYHVGSESS